MVTPLMFIVRSKTSELGIASDESLEVIKPKCIILYSLVTVCGYKAVVRFFPHQVSDLELAVSLLEKCHHTKSVSSLRQESTGEMEAKCVMLLWLSILVLVPFDHSTVDTSIANNSNLGKLEPAPLVLRIVGFSKDYLSNSGPMSPIAALLLLKLLTRPDMPKAFSSFVEWTHEVLSSLTDDSINHFRLLGATEVPAAIFRSDFQDVDDLAEAFDVGMRKHIYIKSDPLDEILLNYLGNEEQYVAVGDGSWHGGCLALAELAHRGLTASFVSILEDFLELEAFFGLCIRDDRGKDDGEQTRHFVLLRQDCGLQEPPKLAKSKIKTPN
ncbi:hypothetical protein FF1_039637 [Malus domestica]